MVRREREDLMEISPSTPFYCTVLDFEKIEEVTVGERQFAYRAHPKGV